MACIGAGTCARAYEALLLLTLLWANDASTAGESALATTRTEATSEKDKKSNGTQTKGLAGN